MQSIREDYVHDDLVPISPVMGCDRAHHATALDDDPMMLTHPYARTNRDFFFLHEATPVSGPDNTGSVGFEGQLLFSVYLGVVEVVGAAPDDLLRLFFRRLHGRVPPEQVFSHYDAQRIVVFGF
jgi:hypothetical protein